jgi:hypothetical protein
MGATNVIPLRKAPTAKRTRMDTLLVNESVLSTWKIPPFQRPLRVNAKVEAIADIIKADGGVIPGTITLGFIERGADAGFYVVDGQHRLEAFKISGMTEGFADVRIIEHEDMIALGEEFVALNSHIVTMRPDDILRGLEASLPILQRVREACPEIGYDNIRRGPSNAILSMSNVMRMWDGSLDEAPGGGHRTGGVTAIARTLTEESASQLLDFMRAALAAFGREQPSFRLWGSLNLLLCMWLYRRLVLRQGHITQKMPKMDEAQFKRMLMAVAADEDYNDWLAGRRICERDRGMAYNRIKILFARRMRGEGKANPLLPAPPWAPSMVSGLWQKKRNE